MCQFGLTIFFMKKHLIFSILLMSVSLIHAEGVNLTKVKQLFWNDFIEVLTSKELFDTTINIFREIINIFFN